jgi:hypothetical protein
MMIISISFTGFFFPANARSALEARSKVEAFTRFSHQGVGQSRAPSPLLCVEKALGWITDNITEVQLGEKQQERINKLTALAMRVLILGVLGAIPLFMCREKDGKESPHNKTVSLALPFQSVHSEPSISGSTPAPINPWKQIPDTR